MQANDSAMKQAGVLAPTIVDGALEDVTWEDARAVNLANWEDRVPIHEVGYEIERFDDPDFISGVIAQDLPELERHLPGRSLRGLDVCHLQCHIGTDTVSLVRAGAASVTGVDFSPSALAAAKRLADRVGVAAEWVETDVLEARAAVVGEFDVVYTSIGTIGWLADLSRWAKQIAALLKPGGLFYFRDMHPTLGSLDDGETGGLEFRYLYFPNGQAQTWDDGETYIDTEIGEAGGVAPIAHRKTYDWPHSVSEILNALIDAGLEIIRVDEGQIIPWRALNLMEEVGASGDTWHGYALPEPLRSRVPMTLTVIARKPAADAYRTARPAIC